MTDNKYSEDAKNFYLNEKNKQLAKELEDKYGMTHMHTKDEASPEVMNDFLNYAEQWEEAHEKGIMKSLLEILGNPVFKKTEDILHEDIEKEVDKVLEIYASKNIYIDVFEPEEVTEEQFYRFLTEELPIEETEIYGIPGMNTNYSYEDFHPSLKLDAKDTVKFFFWEANTGEAEKIRHWLNKDNLVFNGEQLEEKEFFSRLFEYLPPDKLSDVEPEFISFEFSEKNRVKFDLIAKEGNQTGTPTRCVFVLLRSESGLFDIEEIEIENKM
jgi:hypothetical protein